MYKARYGYLQTRYLHKMPKYLAERSWTIAQNERSVSDYALRN